MTSPQVDMVGVFVVAIAAALTIYAASHALRYFGWTVPRWVLPAGTAIAMISYSIWADYSWAERVAMRLPQGSVVLVEGRESTAISPWTFLAPPVVRFAALDPAKVTSSPEGVKRAEISLFERRKPTLVVPQEFDCTRRLIRVAGGDWAAPVQDDPALARVCS